MALAGEERAEGVIPLTDSQAMETLGESIGKYVRITNIVENRMNGRLINRTIKQTQGQQDFAYNN